MELSATSVRCLPGKCAGLLVPVFALRRQHDFGIGDTLALKQAIDFCCNHDIAVLQTLPIHETIGDHSPYNPITSHGLSPALLSLTPQEVPGLTASILERLAPEIEVAPLRRGRVHHEAVSALKLRILRGAFHFFNRQDSEFSDWHAQLEQFKRDQSYWLPAYTLFRLLVDLYNGNPQWLEWSPEHRNFSAAEDWLASHPDQDHLESSRQEFAYIQWIAWRQWKEVREHASAKNVLLMGELGFGLSRTSADVWSKPELFDLEWNMGTPPLAYFDTSKEAERFGQNWGFPPYRWENHRAENFRWLRERIRGEAQFFHLCRLDHLRGYFRAYMFPWPGGAIHTEYSQFTEKEILERTQGRWPRFVPGPDDDELSALHNAHQGREIIAQIQKAAGNMSLFAEIMGQLPPYMVEALDELSLPNLVFPQLERNEDRSLRPASSYRGLSLAAYANHDHAPLAALFSQLRSRSQQEPTSDAAQDLRHLLDFAGWNAEPPQELSDALLAAFQRALFATPCVLAVLLSSDLLGLSQRFNLPGCFGSDTWNERLELSLSEYECHPVYGPRITNAARFIREAGRACS